MDQELLESRMQKEFDELVWVEDEDENSEIMNAMIRRLMVWSWQNGFSECFNAEKDSGDATTSIPVGIAGEKMSEILTQALSTGAVDLTIKLS